MNEALRRTIREKCDQLDVPLMGVAPADRWDQAWFEPWVPKEFRPRSIFPEARSVIVIGLPVDLPVLETTPSIFYHELYNTVNRLLDEHAYRIATVLNGQGYPSIFTPRDGYGSVEVLMDRPLAFYSHRHAAYLAGLGTFGINNMLLTPDYGPRVRFTSILTATELPADEVMVQDLCIKCMRCVRACPAGALVEAPYPNGLTDKRKCTEYNLGLANRHIQPCGVCIKVCPVGKDRRLFKRTDPRIYSDDDRFSEHHKGWEHVRRYGGK